MLNLKGLVHFTIPVSDIARSEAFYADLLGMKVIQRLPPAVGMLFLRCGRDYLVLSRTTQPIGLEREDDSSIHHAFAVEGDEFDAALMELERNRVKVFLSEVRDQGVFTGRSAYFHDPDGNVLEIIDLNAPAFRALV